MKKVKDVKKTSSINPTFVETVNAIKRIDLHRQVGIPLRTISDWKAGNCFPAKWVQFLILSYLERNQK